MREALRVQVIASEQLPQRQRADIHSLCSRAYAEDLRPVFRTLGDGVHVLGLLATTIVSHAMWVPRWLQAGPGPALRTAYVEMVATEPHMQGRGYATAVMRQLGDAIADYDLGALCPAETSLYSRLGWTFWRGPLFIRSRERLIPTPDERIMILRLPRTPALDLNQRLSAEWRESELW